MKIHLVLMMTTCLCLFLSGCSGEDPSKDPNFVPIYDDFASALEGGNAFLANDRNENAINAFTQATRLDDKNPDGFFQLGVALAERERVEEEKARLSEDRDAAGPTETKSLASRQAFEKAALLYKEKTKSNPKDHSSFFNLGRALNRLDQDSEAEQAYREALEISPENNEYRIKLGETLMKLAKWGEAVTQLRKAAEADPENFDLAEKIESAELGRKRLAFDPTPSPSPSPSPEVPLD